jgi:hypothetical protein
MLLRKENQNLLAEDKNGWRTSSINIFSEGDFLQIKNV